MRRLPPAFPPDLALSRRELLQVALSTAAAATAAPAMAAAAPVAPALASNPFRLLGVASGDPIPTGVVLWSRLALDLADTERWGLDSRCLSGRAGRCGRPTAAGASAALRASATAAREKGYAVARRGRRACCQRGPTPTRFRIGDFEAPGLTRTAPARRRYWRSELRFCFGSCAEYEYELYFVYDAIANEKPDLVVHLGDYIYEETYDRFFKAGPDTRARRLQFDREQPLTTLAQYRRRYAEHKTDADAAARACGRTLDRHLGRS